MSRSPPSIRRSQSGSTDTRPASASPLLFINKDPSNLTRTAEEVYAVGSHVSRGSRKWRRTKSTLALDSSTGRILAAAGLDSPTALSRTPSPVQSKPINIKWRLENSKVATSNPADCITPPATKKAKQVKSATSSPSPPMSTTAVLSSQAPPEQNHGQSIRSLLTLYFQTIRPFARSISSQWLWIDNMSVVQGSPALTYALCAFASAFEQGVSHGLHTLALPPATRPGETVPWHTPAWFQFQAQAISLLRRHLADVADADRTVQKAELHAILFLMRLSIILGDRQTALLHLDAIQRATENAAVLPDLHLDMSMWKVNLVLAFRYQSRVSLRPYVHNDNPSLQTPLVDFDASKVANFSEWNHLCAITRDRTLLWRPQEPHLVDPAQGDLVQDLLEADNNLHTMDVNSRRDVRICAQLSRYLVAYVRYINADTSLGLISHHVGNLKNRISLLTQIDVLWRELPRLMLYISHAGCLASRGQPSDRRFFIRLLHAGLSSIGDMTTNASRDRTINAARDLLGAFIESGTTHESLAREMWEEVATAKESMA